MDMDTENPVAVNTHGRLEPARIADVIKLAVNPAAAFCWKAVVRAHADKLQSDYEMLEAISGVCQSPIEKYLVAGLYEAGHKMGVAVNLCGRALTGGPNAPVNVTPQHAIGPYFADFTLVGFHARIVAECDGADFHTDKARDSKRTAVIEAAGWRVIRFAGSELFKDPCACARALLEAAIRGQ